MPRPTHPVLSQRALNRATLARQLLLEAASDLDPVAALERIGGAPRGIANQGRDGTRPAGRG